MTSPLAWSVFRSLPGPQHRNWEVLCRELVRRHYGQFGSLRSSRQQPGVEFHLLLDVPCDLGGKGAHWGWQCRWYREGTRLTARQRAKIIEAIDTTLRYFASMTDWVLWTRDPLSASDEAWLARLSGPVRLHSWHEDTVAGLLVGPAAPLRETYFGDLVLTRDALTTLHREALAPVSHRYKPNLHVVTGAEERLLALVAVDGAIDELRPAGARLNSVAARVDAIPGEPDNALRLAVAADAVSAVAQAIDATRALRDAIADMLAADNLHAARELRTTSGEGGAEQSLALMKGHSSALTRLRESVDEAWRVALEFDGLRLARADIGPRLTAVRSARQKCARHGRESLGSPSLRLLACVEDCLQTIVDALESALDEDEDDAERVPRGAAGTGDGLGDDHEPVGFVAGAATAKLRDDGDTTTLALAPIPDDVKAGLLSSRQQVDSERASLERLHADLAWCVAEAGAAARDCDAVLERVRRTAVCAIGSGGSGKTQLAARLTEDGNGILLLGRQFGRGISSDQIARESGLAAGTREDLLEALEALGARERRRKHIVIDGLNESEHPSDWKIVLARLATRLIDFPHVVLFVTLRPSYASEAVPPDVPRVELEGFGSRVLEATSKYLSAYHVTANLSDLPLDRFGHPLFLRIFMEAANPNQGGTVELDARPQTLNAAFAQYVRQACHRVAELLEMDPDGVRASLSAVARLFWSESARVVPWHAVKAAVGDAPRDWVQSLARAFAAEELVHREQVGDSEEAAFGFDLLGGFLIAQALLDDAHTAFGSDETLETLETHPLAEDIIAALAGLLPVRRGEQLWRLFPPWTDARNLALLQLPALPATAVDQQSVDEFVKLGTGEEVFNALRASRFLPEHPLNAGFLDGVLAGMPMWQRDLRWSEWLRQHADLLIDEVAALAGLATKLHEKAGRLSLSVLWASWLLPSCDERMRRAATQAIFTMGMAAPMLVARRAVASLDVEDSSVLLGTVTALYGIALRSGDESSPEFVTDATEAAAVFTSAQNLSQAPEARHLLVRALAARLGEVSGLRDGVSDRQVPSSGAGRDRRAATARFDRTDAVDIYAALRDFDVGRFVLAVTGWPARAEWEQKGRKVAGGRETRMVDGVNPELELVKRQVAARVCQMGYRETRFRAVDGERQGQARYGSKYAWNAVLEIVGDSAFSSPQPALRTPAESTWPEVVPVDPSFLEPVPRRDSSATRAWTALGEVLLAEEVGQPMARPASEVFCVSGLQGHVGRWVLCDALSRIQAPDGEHEERFEIYSVLCPRDFDGAPFRGYWDFRDRLDAAGARLSDFAGEVRWRDQHASHARDWCERRIQTLADGRVVALIRILSWRDYRERVGFANGPFGHATGLPIPSEYLVASRALHGIGGTLAYYDVNGHAASCTLLAPKGHAGAMLYLRADVLAAIVAESDMTVRFYGHYQRSVRQKAAGDPAVGRSGSPYHGGSSAESARQFVVEESGGDWWVGLR